jgi:hypothetical protein
MAPRKNRNNAASMLHSIAEELGCAPELVGAVKKELKLRKRDDIKHAVQERIAKMAEQDAPSEPKTAEAADGAEVKTDEAKPKKEAKPGLTLSQRRALLKLLDGAQQPATQFKALPYEKFVDVGYADRVILDENGDDVTNDAGIGVYTLTPQGRARAESINPGYRVWAAGETVAGDESRPEAGTWRASKAAAEAAKAKAEAEAKVDEPEVGDATGGEEPPQADGDDADTDAASDEKVAIAA